VLIRRLRLGSSFGFCCASEKTPRPPFGHPFPAGASEGEVFVKKLAPSPRGRGSQYLAMPRFLRRRSSAPRLSPYERPYCRNRPLTPALSPWERKPVFGDATVSAPASLGVTAPRSSASFLGPLSLLLTSQLMTISQAKLEANRRNAAKSTGPRTEGGKRVSSLNAVTHGLRAETLVLGEEDPQALEARREAWHGCLLPADDVEQRLVDDAVVHTWIQDRARRAQAVRANANLTQYGVAQAVNDAKEVEELGQRLYKDRLGPLTFYPTGSEFAKVFDKTRTATTSYAGLPDTHRLGCQRLPDTHGLGLPDGG
jgi:hypothetical protein